MASRSSVVMATLRSATRRAQELSQPTIGAELGYLDGGVTLAQDPRDLGTGETGQTQLEDARLIGRKPGQERAELVVVVGARLRARPIRHRVGGRQHHRRPQRSV